MLGLLRHIIAGVTVLAAITGVGTAAASVRAQHSDAATAAQSVRVSFANAAGDAADAPLFDVAHAYPGMSPRVAEAAVTNDGLVAVDYELSVVMTSSASAPSLADVLVLTVRRHDDIVYRGPLADFFLAETAPLAPTSTRSYRMTITWPDGGPSDNQYQATALDFSFVARSRSAEVDGKRPRT